MDESRAILQNTAMWKQIEDAIHQQKLEDQNSYRKMLDDQIKEKESMNHGIGVGSMTLTERRMNGIDEQGEQSLDTTIAHLPGVNGGESPFLSFAQSHSMRRAIK